MVLVCYRVRNLILSLRRVIPPVQPALLSRPTRCELYEAGGITRVLGFHHVMRQNYTGFSCCPSLLAYQLTLPHIASPSSKMELKGGAHAVSLAVTNAVSFDFLSSAY